jgi:hypothetical protein
MLRFLLLFCLVTAACSHEPLPGIEGEWRQVVPAHPVWLYSIRDNIFHQTVTDFGQVLADRQFPYAQRGDTLFIGGDANQVPRVWVFRMMGDGAAEVTDIPQGPLNLNPVRILERN